MDRRLEVRLYIGAYNSVLPKPHKPRPEEMLLGKPQRAIKNSLGALQWVLMRVSYPAVYDAILCGDFKPLETLCKVNGWEMPRCIHGEPGKLFRIVNRSYTEYRNSKREGLNHERA